MARLAIYILALSLLSTEALSSHPTGSGTAGSSCQSRLADWSFLEKVAEWDPPLSMILPIDRTQPMDTNDSPTANLYREARHAKRFKGELPFWNSFSIAMGLLPELQQVLVQGSGIEVVDPYSNYLWNAKSWKQEEILARGQGWFDYRTTNGTLIRMSKNLSEGDFCLLSQSRINVEPRELMELRIHYLTADGRLRYWTRGYEYGSGIQIRLVPQSTLSGAQPMLRALESKPGTRILALEVVHNHPFEAIIARVNGEERFIHFPLSDTDYEFANTLQRLSRYPVVLTAIQGLRPKKLMRMSVLLTPID